MNVALAGAMFALGMILLGGWRRRPALVLLGLSVGTSAVLFGRSSELNQTWIALAVAFSGGLVSYRRGWSDLVWASTLAGTVGIVPAVLAGAPSTPIGHSVPMLAYLVATAVATLFLQSREFALGWGPGLEVVRLPRVWPMFVASFVVVLRLYATENRPWDSASSFLYLAWGGFACAWAARGEEGQRLLLIIAYAFTTLFVVHGLADEYGFLLWSVLAVGAAAVANGAPARRRAGWALAGAGWLVFAYSAWENDLPEISRHGVNEIWIAAASAMVALLLLVAMLRREGTRAVWSDGIFTLFCSGIVAVAAGTVLASFTTPPLALPISAGAIVAFLCGRVYRSRGALYVAYGLGLFAAEALVVVDLAKLGTGALVVFLFIVEVAGFYLIDAFVSRHSLPSGPP